MSRFAFGFGWGRALVSAPQIPAPSAPENLVIVSVSHVVALSWDVVAEADHYAAYRATSPSGPYTLLDGAVALNSYTDTTAPSDTTLYYIVRSRSASEAESEDSNEVSAFPSAILKFEPVFFLNCKAPGTFIIDESNLVSQINDFSGNGRHLAQATQSDQPTLLSGDTLAFDGSRWLEGAHEFSAQDFFFVITPTTLTARPILGKMVSNAGGFYKGVSAFRLTESVVPSVAFFVNGIEGHQANNAAIVFPSEKIVVRAKLASAIAATTFALGRASTATSSLFDGAMNDVAVFDSALSDADALEVIQHLAIKWAIDITKPEIVNIGTVSTTSNPTASISGIEAPALTGGYMLAVIASTGDHNPTGVTWQGLPLTQIGSAYVESDLSNVTLWEYLLGETSEAQSGNVVATFDNSARHAMAVMLFSRVNQSSPRIDVDGVVALANTPMGLTLDSASDAVLVDIVHWSGGTVGSGGSGTGQTQLLNTNGTVSVARQERCSLKRGSGASDSMEQTRTSPEESAYAAVALRAA